MSSYERLAKLTESFLGKPKEAIGHYQKLLTMVDSEEKKTQYNAMINFLNSQLNPKTQKTPDDVSEDEGAGDESSDASDVESTDDTAGDEDTGGGEE